jgi:hypothetical protein
MLQLSRAKKQRQLFEEEVPVMPVRVQLPSDIQDQLQQSLMQWMQALAKRIQEEAGNES